MEAIPPRSVAHSAWLGHAIKPEGPARHRTIHHRPANM
jgi:hypothetical protein